MQRKGGWGRKVCLALCYRRERVLTMNPVHKEWKIKWFTSLLYYGEMRTFNIVTGRLPPFLPFHRLWRRVGLRQPALTGVRSRHLAFADIRRGSDATLRS